MGKHLQRTISDNSLTYRRDQDRHQRSKPPSTASTCYAPACPPPTSMPPAWTPATRTSPTSNATSAASNPTTSTYVRSITGSPNGSKPRADLPAGLLCDLAPTQSLGTADLHRRAPPARDNQSHPPSVHQQPRPKPPRRQAPEGTPLRSFRGLLTHLATLTRNDIRYHGINTDVPTLAEPTPDQRRAFDLINATIPYQCGQRTPG